MLLGATKSKRYTRTRLDRMVMCAFLGITAQMLTTHPPYARVLALINRIRKILKLARQTGKFINVGQTVDHPYQQLENRCSDLYGLFAAGAPEAPGMEAKQRIFCR